jgi:hypothetical protein
MLISPSGFDGLSLIISASGHKSVVYGCLTVISNAELGTVKIERNEFHGGWNYCIRSG